MDAVNVEHWNEERDGVMNEAALRLALERRGFAVSRYVYPPGTYFPEHTHGVDKIDAVLRGRFKLVLEGRAVVLGAGDMVHVPAGALHSAEVLGDEAVVSLDAVRR
jgi:quercetin dioxygenase-like cupin family protein